MELGAPVEKIVLGLPMYGKTFVITNLPIHNSAESPMGASAFDKGFMGSFTKEIGILGYNEVSHFFDFNKIYISNFSKFRILQKFRFIQTSHSFEFPFLSNYQFRQVSNF